MLSRARRLRTCEPGDKWLKKESYFNTKLVARCHDMYQNDLSVGASTATKTQPCVYYQPVISAHLGVRDGRAIRDISLPVNSLNNTKRDQRDGTNGIYSEIAENSARGRNKKYKHGQVAKAGMLATNVHSAGGYVYVGLKLYACAPYYLKNDSRENLFHPSTTARP